MYLSNDKKSLHFGMHCVYAGEKSRWLTIAINTQTPRFSCLPEENMILQHKFIHSFFISHKVDL